MNLQTMSSVSAELILRYYENEPMSFLEHMDDEAMWYGPAEGQFIRGREEMIRAWSREEHPLTFTVASMKTRANSAHPSSCNVMLTYTVVTHDPNGHDISVFVNLDDGAGDPYGEKAVAGKLIPCKILLHDHYRYPVLNHRHLPCHPLIIICLKIYIGIRNRYRVINR